MLVVNLFGAPGAGKSTGAARIFSNLKLKGINAELVTEYAKDAVWEENKGPFKDQLYIFAQQNYRLTRLRDKVDVVVTDSPLLLSLLYNSNQDFYSVPFEELVKQVFDQYNNLNFFLERVKPYNPIGRFQTEKESDELSDKLKNLLFSNGYQYTLANGSQKDYDGVIMEIIKRRLEDANANKS